MALKLRKQSGAILALDNETLPLSSYGVQKYDSITITSNGAKNTDFSTFEHVPKYEISQEEYLKRPDNAAAWMTKNLSKVERSPQMRKDDTVAYSDLKVGDRIMVLKSNDTSVDSPQERYHLATVSFINPVHFQEPLSNKGHQWIGVIYDGPNLGKHNGTVDGICYFKCASNQGSFVRRRNCHPQLALNDEDDLETLEL